MSTPSNHDFEQSHITEAHTDINDIERSVSNQTLPESITSKEYDDSIKGRDYKNKIPIKTSLWLAFQALGSVYGDIGTSPLYAYSSIFDFDKEPNTADLYGGLSLIFWTITLTALIKYVFIVVRYGGNNGEGGIIALYCKVARVLNIGQKGIILPGENETDDLLLLKRNRTSGSFQHGKKAKLNKFSGHQEWVRWGMIVLICLACGLVISDGLLTPTTSVLSAIEGIKGPVPHLEQWACTGISIAIIFLLFIVQSWGSAKLSIFFSPILMLWFIAIFIIGVRNITYHPGIFRALSPKYAVSFLHDHGIWTIGGAMLAITGCEAMFSDLGHFNANSIQISFSLVVYPSLIITYLGQGAYAVSHPGSYSNIFYASIPGSTNGPIYWIVFVIATLATIIASQALILGVSAILRQLIALDCFPKIKIVHVSEKVFGKIYIPFINYLLMIGVILTIVGFRRSANVTAAYGLAVSLDLFINTCFTALTLYYHYELYWLIPLTFFILSGSLEMTYVISGFKKVPKGAWFPLVTGIICGSFFFYWRYCRSLKVDYEFSHRVKIGDVFNIEKDKSIKRDLEGEVLDLGQGKPKIEITTTTTNTSNNSKTDILRIPGISIVFTNALMNLNSPNTIPDFYARFVKSFDVAQENVILLSIHRRIQPFVEEEDRFCIQKISGINGFWRIVVQYGFMDEVKIDENFIRSLASMIIDTSDIIDGDINKIYNNINIFYGRQIIKSKKINLKGFGKLRQPFRKYFIETIFGRIDSIFQGIETLGTFETERDYVAINSSIEI